VTAMRAVVDASCDARASWIGGRGAAGCMPRMAVRASGCPARLMLPVAVAAVAGLAVDDDFADGFHGAYAWHSEPDKVSPAA
jgi:hypothetical protein